VGRGEEWSRVILSWRSLFCAVSVRRASVEVVVFCGRRAPAERCMRERLGG
jgi:hypothetical protein